MIKVWQSYACNNSAAYRLVARFADAAAAAEVAAELDEFCVAQEQARSHRRRTTALSTLARTYGNPEWTDHSSGNLGVFAQGDLVVVYHTMSLGLGPGVAAYLEDRGGKPERESAWTLQLSVLFRIEGSRDEQLAVFEAIFDAEKQQLTAAPPWARFPPSGHAVWFRDGGTVGLFFPANGCDVVAFKAWLGIDDAVIRIDRYDDRELFAALAAARCASCDRKLDYLDPLLHDIEAPQLVCRPCGGLYDLSTFYTP